jgi:hypothetical protein
MSLYLELQTSDSSDDPQTVISEIVGVAQRIGVPVHVDIGGVLVMSYPGDDPLELYRKWKEILESNKHRYARVAIVKA